MIFKVRVEEKSIEDVIELIETGEGKKGLQFDLYNEKPYFSHVEIFVNTDDFYTLKDYLNEQT